MAARTAKRKSKPKSKVFSVEKKLVAQIRFYEELHVIKDENGETLFVGTEAMTKRILKALRR
jgi:hypothetical protein